MRVSQVGLLIFSGHLLSILANFGHCFFSSCSSSHVNIHIFLLSNIMTIFMHICSYIIIFSYMHFFGFVFLWKYRKRKGYL